MIREILHYPNGSLKQTATPVQNLTGDLVQAVDDMVETMYDAPGIGLAAIQIGLPQRIIVVDINHEERGKELLKLINPVITAREGDIIWEEGCLSVIDYTAEVKRSAKIEIKAWTPDEKEIILQAEELMAVVIQHELDHLDGKLFIDRISRLKRELYARRVKKLLREGRPLESSRKDTDGDLGVGNKDFVGKRKH
ncbi:MAG: peptide deformylase [Deltaproteobacteria bacterium]|nr:peptide deformylase [Deltaproteobacteria bacterium]